MSLSTTARQAAETESGGNKKGLILIVEDDADIAKLLSQRLNVKKYECHIARNGEDAVVKARSLLPDLILLDLMLPKLNGFEVKRRLNEFEATATIPVIFLTARDDVEDKVQGLSLDAADYMCKPFEFRELFARIETAVRRRRHYEHIASTDPLTGLNNLLFFKRQMQLHFETAARYNRPFSVAVIDINDFKTINDTHGHAAGDAVIQSLANLMRQIFRKSDLPMRYGGDEFVVLFPETRIEEADLSLKRLEEKVAAEAVNFGTGHEPIRYSVSSGAAGFSGNYRTPEELFEAADKKMYENKPSKDRSARKLSIERKTA